MKNFGDELKRLIPKNFAERQAEAIAKLENHPEVQRIKSEFPDRIENLTHPTNFGAISRHITCYDNCTSCSELTGCENDLKGHRSVVEEDTSKDTALVYRLLKCHLMTGFEKQQEIGTLIKSHHVPSSVLNATFDDIEPDPQRRAAIIEAIKFCTDFVKGETVQGLYLYGQMGVGKSRIAAAIAQELAKRGIDVVMVYVPDFLSEVKDAINSNTVTVESKLDALRESSVLILDDIGAESLTTWTRDEVLGPILQRRMERLPTLYTSNLNMKELQRHLTNVKDAKDFDKKQHEKKAERIIERIEPFVKIFPVGGRNRRRG